METRSPVSLPELVCALQSSLLDGAAITRALECPVERDVLLAHARFDPERYPRVALHTSPAFEVRLLCWLPGQSSALHGHDMANGAMRVLRGRGVERRLGLADRELVEDAVYGVEPGVVHQVANTGSEPMVTLHVYAPPLPVDQPSQVDGRHVVIVGGGWSGVAVAIQLLRRGPADLRVTIVEPGELGRGVAYGAAGLSHTLNVPAGRMGVDPEVPEDFLAYARARGVAAGPRSLLPRRLYGDYVLDRLAGAVRSSPAKLRLERSRVTGVDRNGGGWGVALADGKRLRAEHVVMASGHGPTSVPDALRAAGVPTVVGTDLLARPDRLAPDARVLLVGTGLTALDVIGAIESRGQRGPIHAVSHTGKWPHRHLATLAWTGAPFVVDPHALPATADGLAQWFDAAVATARAAGTPWQAVVDAVRPHVAGAWRALPAEEQARFLQVYRPEWERLRHRAPCEQVDGVSVLEDAGRVVRHRGTILRAERSGSAWTVYVGVPGGPAAHAVDVDSVVLCTGPSSDVRGFGAPWPGLIAAGHVRPDVHGLGVVAGERGEVLGADGVGEGLWAIGGLLRPRDFESTAVPELAKQARTLGGALIEAIRAHT